MYCEYIISFLSSVQAPGVGRLQERGSGCRPAGVAVRPRAVAERAYPQGVGSMARAAEAAGREDQARAHAASLAGVALCRCAVFGGWR